MPHSALYTLFMQAPAFICVLRGPDHVFDMVNPLYQRLFPHRELLGRPIREALPELAGQGFFELLDGVFTTGEPFAGKEMPVDQGFFNFVYQPMLVDGRMDGVVIFGFEVTDQVMAQRQANGLADELRQANREKDEFIAVVAHELRTPMTSILGWVRLLQLGDLDEETHAAALEALERSTKAQAKIIEDLLDESRIASGKLRLDLRPLSLAPIVQAAVEMIRPAAEAKGILLVTDIGDEPLETIGDPNRLQQVVANVLSNAIKFSAEGSPVDVRLSRAEAAAEIEVRDRGRGIAPDLLPHIFEHFRQGGSGGQQGGLGLGLAIARHLIELQGGTIAAASEGEGKGATFTLRLPLRADLASQSFVEREHARETALPSLRGVHVLIVEDDVDNRAVIAAVMERCGATLECTSSAADALQRIELRNPDVIISDVVLPDIDGCAFIGRVRANGDSTRSRIPALALTVFSRPHDRERILAAGFDVLRQKPIEPADLANEVARLVRARSAEVVGRT
ncbi:MAG TPA: ATP-binding protein [Thermoanaerobaculia bacterium]|nr:ATP-binding protein [Thermoanaerobaculia bacterium]